MKISRLLIGLFALMAVSAVNAQEILTGVVKDKTNNETLIGANVYVVNAGNRTLVGASTGIDGDYRLSIPAEKNITVVFSLIGYKSIRMKYTGQKVLNVSLEDEAYTLIEFEVTAKAIEKNQVGLTQKEVVSATQKITMEMLESAPVVSIEDALQGRLANVDIMSGGEPGSSSTIRIRGTSSLNASNEPLIVIDGVPYSTNIASDFEFATADAEDFGALVNVSPSDIESIEVLKDAAATAIWGSKGANGVLLINTKRGKSGKTSFSFSTKYQFGKEPNTIPMLNASQYVAMMQDAIWNTVNDQGYANSGDYLKLLYNTPEIGYNPDYKYFNEYNQNTNWLDEITQTNTSVDNNFSMTGGGEKAKYRIALGYLTEDGTTKGTSFERINSTLSMSYRFSNKLDITTDFSISKGDREANWDNPRGHALTKMPNMSPYYIAANGNRTGEYFTPQGGNFQGNVEVSSGELKGVFNPLAVVNESVNKTSSTDSRFTFTMHYKFFQGLDYWGIASLNIKKTKNKRFLPQSVTGLSWTDAWFNRSTDAISDNVYLNTDNKLIYTKTVDDHKAVLTLALQTRESTNSSYTSEVSGNASPATADPTAGGNIVKMESGASQTREVGTIFNAHYGFKERYMVNGAYRYEASSAMGANNRWASFPTVGVAWIASEEHLLKEIEWLDALKFRYSWGQSGNAPSGSYSYIGTFKAMNPGYIDMTAVEPNQIQLDNLKWETVTQNNLGLDVFFLKEKLRLSFDLYSKKTVDMLQKDVNLPSSSGYPVVKWFNSGSMSNEGWEFRIDWDFLKTKDWSASANFNISQNKNKITKMPDNLTDYKYTFGNGNYAYKVKEGDPLGSFYGYKYAGVYQNTAETYARDKSGVLIHDINGNPVGMKNGDQKVQPGDAKYVDMNGDGIINQYDIVYLGNSMPMFNGGGGFTVKYKAWSVNAFFHGRAGQKAVNQTRINTENMRGKSNQSVAVLRRWRSEGDQTDIPRALYDKGYNYLGSDRFVEDASFIRLKTVTLRYMVPSSMLKKANINKLDLWLTGYDLYTWTNYTGQDPEVSLSKDDGVSYLIAKDNSSTPKAMRFAFGLTLGF